MTNPISKRLLVLASLLLSVPAYAQTPVRESEVKAMFVYNFLQFVEWPPAVRTRDPFVVLIIGDGATADAAERFLKSKTIGERQLVVRRARWDQSLTGVRAALVVEQDTQRLYRILDAAAVAGVLTIGEGDSFTTRGGVIGLLVQNHKVRFDVNTSAAQISGLRVSSKLLTLTRVIRSSTDRSRSEE